MAKHEPLTINATVEQALPNAQFKLKLENGKIILGHLSGKMRKNFIRILPGDKVEVEMSPYDLTKGRITFRESGGGSKPKPSTKKSKPIRKKGKKGGKKDRS